MDLSIAKVVVESFGLPSEAFQFSQIGTGHINKTFKLSGPQSYILQRINTAVFVKPELVEDNIREASEYLKRHYPGYLFMSPVVSPTGRGMMYDSEGAPWRLYPYLENSFTIDEATTSEQAFNAAAEFGRLANRLSNCPPDRFKPTIDRFHDLALRYAQLESALAIATEERKKEAADAIQSALHFSFLVTRYTQLIQEGTLVQRVFHNDTKINNVLFDRKSGNTLAVIDLDTLMPGYFIYDLGDLLRTVVCPVSEEEKDLSRIEIRKEFMDAVVEGYLSEMSGVLTSEERKHVSFAGPMMIYIMAIRFLADFLRGDTYYHITYPGQNLVRARNQLRLLELFPV